MSDPTIQLPAGPPEDATGHWAVSLAEIDAMCRKAARGAGYTWGMAEEAGRSARCLSAWGLPGPETVLAALEAMDQAVPAHAPRPAGREWQASAGALCPVATGAALSDRAAEIRAGRTIELGPVMFPLLLLPPVWLAAREMEFAVCLRGGEIDVTVVPEGPAARDWEAIRAPAAERIAVARSDFRPEAPLPRRPNARSLPVTVWRGLERFAQRTYAPATAASRRGAGAGVLDAD